MANQWKCPKCGMIQQMPLQMFSNHCARCNEPNLASRLSTLTEYPKVVDPPAILCYAAKSQTAVVATPDLTAETLYIIGPGDILPIAGEEDGFYQLLLPGKEKGYVQKSAGIKVPVGLGEVKEPLGYARLTAVYKNAVATVVVPQPDGTSETVHILKPEDRFPIVEEREHSFIVQLPSGIRGWVEKGKVSRTISPNSLPPQESSDLASTLGLAALLGIAMIGGALVGDPEEARIRRGVEQALRDRGM